MADTFTTTLNLTKPEVGASADTWGTKTNDNWDDVDALFSAGPVLKVANGGTAATTASGARTNLGLGTIATQDASAVTITGGSATLGSLVVSATNPVAYFYETDADTDEKYWRLLATSGGFTLAAVSDAIDSANVLLEVARTGTTVDSIALTATAVTINGNAAHHAGTFAAPTSGSFTISLRSGSSGGTVLGTATAYWRKFNSTVYLRVPQISPAGTDTVFWLTGLPADIQVGALGTGNAQYIPIGVINEGLGYPGVASLADSASAFQIFSGASAWTSSISSKGIAHTNLVYQIA